jgi:hypothetical protein
MSTHIYGVLLTIDLMELSLKINTHAPQREDAIAASACMYKSWSLAFLAFATRLIIFLV